MVRGNTISADIVQINCKIVKAGAKPIEQLLGKEEKKEEAKPEEKPKEKPTEKKEENKPEEKKEEAKPKKEGEEVHKESKS
jgi:chromatin remodeling complex protein RSC6